MGRSPPPSWTASPSGRRKGGGRGCDGHKRVSGRKRHLLVDTNGLMLGCVVTPADVGDRAGSTELLARVWLMYPRLSRLWADGNYGGPLVEWVKNCWGYTLEIVQGPPEQKGFSVLPRRWVVERTFAWLGQWRQLAKDYEQSPCSEVAFIQLAMIGLGLNRLA